MTKRLYLSYLHTPNFNEPVERSGHKQVFLSRMSLHLSGALQVTCELMNEFFVFSSPFPSDEVSILGRRDKGLVVVEDYEVTDEVLFDC